MSIILDQRIYLRLKHYLIRETRILLYLMGKVMKKASKRMWWNMYVIKTGISSKSIVLIDGLVQTCTSNPRLVKK